MCLIHTCWFPYTFCPTLHFFVCSTAFWKFPVFSHSVLSSGVCILIHFACAFCFCSSFLLMLCSIRYHFVVLFVLPLPKLILLRWLYAYMILSIPLSCSKIHVRHSLLLFVLQALPSGFFALTVFTSDGSQALRLNPQAGKTGSNLYSRFPFSSLWWVKHL